MPQIYTYSDELTHYGRLGMKWGQHIFGKERYTRMTRKRALKKARKTRAKNLAEKKEQKALADEVRAKALTDPELFQKNKHLFTTEEIESITKRYKAESALATSINDLREQRYKKLERGKNYVNLVVAYGTNTIGAYNNIAKVYNAFAPEDKKRWPIIGDKGGNQQSQQKKEDGEQKKETKKEEKKSETKTETKQESSSSSSSSSSGFNWKVSPSDLSSNYQPYWNGEPMLLLQSPSKKRRKKKK